MPARVSGGTSDAGAALDLEGQARAILAMDPQADLLRECCRYGGGHIWCEEDDAVLASQIPHV
jgi:hypothetical protein